MANQRNLKVGDRVQWHGAKFMCGVEISSVMWRGTINKIENDHATVTIDPYWDGLSKVEGNSLPINLDQMSWDGGRLWPEGTEVKQ